MRVVYQRVKRAACRVDGAVTGEIGPGLLVFLGIHREDTEAEASWLAGKLVQVRIFPDAAGQMNRSVRDIDGEILLISQFTLYGNLRKGTRPSFNRSAGPDRAVPLYERTGRLLEAELGRPLAWGRFGADMQIEAHNDGPVTGIIDTHDKRF
ncbi:MAG: D-aminoacyl-tRNA deacylase [Opitutales bacterium]